MRGERAQRLRLRELSLRASAWQRLAHRELADGMAAHHMRPDGLLGAAMVLVDFSKVESARGGFVPSTSKCKSGPNADVRTDVSGVSL
jgi:hypothetical protein